MLAKIKHTLKHTAIYGLGNIMTKLIGIVLLPIYTKQLMVSEYGVLGILEVTMAILSQVLLLGQSNSFLRFHDIEEYKEKKKSTLFTIFIFLISIVIVFNLIGQNFIGQFSSLFSKSTEFALYFRLCFYIVSLQIINTLFLSVLRAKEKSTFYAAVNIIKVSIVLGCNIYFVAYVRLGITGILYSYLIGEGIAFLMLFPNMLLEMIPKFDWKILSISLSFGAPLIFVSLAHMLLNTGDRYILKLLTNYKEVGLYSLGYKIAGILNVFFIQSFSLGFLPIAYKMYGQEGDKRYYSKMLTYFVFVLFWTGLGLAFFSKEIIQLFALNPDYWAAYQVVPYIILAYIFSGAKSVVNLGLYLKRKTNYVAYNTLGAMILNIGLNFLLIPKYKMVGAAVATVLSFMALYLVTYFIANHFYQIPYENLKIFKMLVLSLVLYLLSTLTLNMDLWIRLVLKLGMLISFPFLLYPLNFYEKIEITRIKEGFHKICPWV